MSKKVYSVLVCHIFQTFVYVVTTPFTVCVMKTLRSGRPVDNKSSDVGKDLGDLRSVRP